MAKKAGPKKVARSAADSTAALASESTLVGSGLETNVQIPSAADSRRGRRTRNANPGVREATRRSFRSTAVATVVVRSRTAEPSATAGAYGVSSESRSGAERSHEAAPTRIPT